MGILVALSKVAQALGAEKGLYLPESCYLINWNFTFRRAFDQLVING